MLFVVIFSYPLW